jgi:hypothetical protein
MRRDWEVTLLYCSNDRAYFHVQGINHCHPPGHRDREFYWSVVEPFCHRFDYTNATVTEAALQRMVLRKIATELPSRSCP